MLDRISPGLIRDSIIEFLNAVESATVTEIQAVVAQRLGHVPSSSVRSYLYLNTPETFERLARGRFQIRRRERLVEQGLGGEQYSFGLAALTHADCFAWMKAREPQSIHAIVTDPPYGLVEYTEREQSKLRTGRGGVWRVPPSFDGHRRSPLPRFTVLDDKDRRALRDFFHQFGLLAQRVIVPGANVIVATNPLVASTVAQSLTESGLEMRGQIIRLVMTMRGGDRPKNAHEEFAGVSVMPRSMFEPWIVLRKPLEGRVQDNLRKWQTGGFRRPSQKQPFGDVITSSPTPKRERQIAPHPSLKPQAFLRTLIRGSLPVGRGLVLDPFAGSGSTLAAATAVGYESVGVEKDPHYFAMAKIAMPQLAAIAVKTINPTLP